MPTPQIFDLIVLILIGWLTLRGMMRGIVAQVMSIVSLVICWIVAVKFSPVVAPMVSDDPPWNKLIAMLVLFIASFLAMWFIRGLMDGMIRVVRLKSVDRSLGGVLGFAKGVLLGLIITFFLTIFSPTTRDFALESISGKFFARGIERISALVPNDMNEILSRNIAKFYGAFEEKFGPDPIPLDNPLLSAAVRGTVEQVKGEISTIFSLSDLETQSPLIPSPLREKVASTPAISPESPEPAEQPRRAVLPFQPNR